MSPYLEFWLIGGWNWVYLAFFYCLVQSVCGRHFAIIDLLMALRLLKFLEQEKSKFLVIFIFNILMSLFKYIL